MTSPRSTTPSSPPLCDFGIVIPTLDHAEHLETCLASILTQEGQFSVHLHIQNGGKKELIDSFVSPALKRWSRPTFHTTVATEKDKNLANAINKGFANVNAEMLTWLGSDDFLFPGCLQAIQSLLEQHPKVRWLTGLPQTVSEDGVLLGHYGQAGFSKVPTGYSRESLIRGQHASLFNHGTIQQEGTFWHRSLWEKSMGVDERLALAIDFDLWSRFAIHEELYEIALPLAAFRSRTGQLSENQEGYRDEIEWSRSLSTQASNCRNSPSKGLTNYVAHRDQVTHVWVLSPMEYRLWFPVLGRAKWRLPSASALVGAFTRALTSLSVKSPLIRGALRIMARTVRKRQ